MTISRRGRFFVPDTEERQGKETENLSLFLFSFCGFLEQSGNLFCQCHDGQNRRVAHCFWQNRGVLLADKGHEDLPVLAKTGQGPRNAEHRIHKQAFPRLSEGGGKSFPQAFLFQLSKGSSCHIGRSFRAFGVSRSKIGIAERNVIVTPWSGCDE